MPRQAASARVLKPGRHKPSPAHPGRPALFQAMAGGRAPLLIDARRDGGSNGDQRGSSDEPRCPCCGLTEPAGGHQRGTREMVTT